jgi:hypothetical protein
VTVTASNYDRKANEFYETEPWVTEVLLRHFPVVGLSVWDPCAGNHMMSDVLREAGRGAVFTSDLVTYGRKHDKKADFFTLTNTGFDAIVANPPYGKGNRIAVKWAERSLDLCDGIVALLLTAKFDSGRTRAHLFRDNPRFAAKIVLLDRISWTLDGVTGTEDNAWFVWGPEPRGRRRPPMIVYEERPR